MAIADLPVRLTHDWLSYTTALATVSAVVVALAGPTIQRRLRAPKPSLKKHWIDLTTDKIYLEISNRRGREAAKGTRVYVTEIHPASPAMPQSPTAASRFQPATQVSLKWRGPEVEFTMTIPAGFPAKCGFLVFEQQREETPANVSLDMGGERKDLSGLWNHHPSYDQNAPQWARLRVYVVGDNFSAFSRDVRVSFRPDRYGSGHEARITRVIDIDIIRPVREKRQWKWKALEARRELTWKLYRRRWGNYKAVRIAAKRRAESDKD